MNTKLDKFMYNAVAILFTYIALEALIVYHSISVSLLMIIVLLLIELAIVRGEIIDICEKRILLHEKYIKLLKE